MFNRKLNSGLFKCILICSAFILSSCTEKKYNSYQVTNQELDTSEQANKVKFTEYIIVLKKGANITVALNSLKIDGIRLVKDLKRDRYLVGMKNDPGINKLRQEIMSSIYIKHIQPNFIYTTQ